MKNYKFYIFVFSFAFVLLSASCSALRKPLKEMGAETVLLNAEKNQFKYDNLITDFSLLLTGDNHAEFTGQLRMEKDKIVWLRVLSLGVEVARIKITPDSIYFVNRINKEIAIRTTESLLANYQISNIQPFEILQNILTGNLFLLYNSEMYKALVDNRAYRLQTTRHVLANERRADENNDYTAMQSIWLEPRNYKVINLDMKGLEVKDKIKMKYSAFEDINHQKIPTKVEIEYRSESKYNITIYYSNPEINLDLDFPFKLPKKYQIK